MKIFFYAALKGCTEKPAALVFTKVWCIPGDPFSSLDRAVKESEE
jgi:hypothetical protein